MHTFLLKVIIKNVKFKNIIIQTLTTLTHNMSLLQYELIQFKVTLIHSN